MESVTARDEVARNLGSLTVSCKCDSGAIGQIAERDILCFVENRRAGCILRPVKVPLDFALAVHGHAPSGQPFEIYAMHFALAGDTEPLVHQTLVHQAITHARLDEQVHGSLLEDSRAHAGLDMVAAMLFQHERFDAFATQEDG